jgi:hypothetical protein
MIKRQDSGLDICTLDCRKYTGSNDETIPCLYTKTHISYIFLMHPLPSLLIPSETLQILFRLFPSSPTSKTMFLLLRAFTTTFASQKTFAHLCASSHFIPTSSEILRLSYFFATLARHSHSSHAPPP